MVNIYHIVSERMIVSPVKAFCGEELDRMNGDYLWADQAATDLHCKGQHCQACLDSDDYILYLLGEAGEDNKGRWSDVDFKYSGTMTGRLNSKSANFGASMQHVLQAGAAKMLKDYAIPDSLFVSKVDYAALERKVSKK